MAVGEEMLRERAFVSASETKPGAALPLPMQDAKSVPRGSVSTGIAVSMRRRNMVAVILSTQLHEYVSRRISVAALGRPRISVAASGRLCFWSGACFG